MKIGNTYTEAGYYLFSKVGLTPKEHCIGLASAAMFHVGTLGTIALVNFVFHRQFRPSFTRVNLAFIGVGVVALAAPLAAPLAFLESDSEAFFLNWKHTLALVEGFVLSQLLYIIVYPVRAVSTHEH